MKPGIMFVALIGVSLALLAGMSGGVRSLEPSAAAAQSAQVPTVTTPQMMWSFQIDEAALTRDMNAWADAQARFQTPVGSVRLHDLSAQLHTDLLVVQGNAELGGMTLPLTLSASAGVESRRAVVHVRAARLGGTDLPESSVGELQQRLQDQIDQATATFHVVVQSISIAEGTLVLQGVRQ
jgi:hypothetical protein